MKLNKTWKIIIGLLTAGNIIAPFLYIAVVFAMMGDIFFFTMADPSMVLPDEEVFNMMRPIFYIFPVMMMASLLQLGLYVFYLAHVIMNKDGTDLLRILLGVGTFLLPYIAMPFYYFVYILPETPPDWALIPSTKIE